MRLMLSFIGLRIMILKTVFRSGYLGLRNALESMAIIKRRRKRTRITTNKYKNNVFCWSNSRTFVIPLAYLMQRSNNLNFLFLTNETNLKKQ